ncbi:MAG: ATP cone domain-containing protein, partial [Oscillospiraceae bacterium]
EMPLLMVQKKDCTFEPFDRTKLIKGIYSAIKKRPVSVDMVSKMVDDVENYFANAMRNQTTSTEIGDMILSILKDLDLVSYVRFASVYKDFNDVESFIKIISELDKKD